MKVLYRQTGSDRDPNIQELWGDCHKLMKYARPSESLSTQLQAFKSIIMLTTRFPCLRRLFLTYKHTKSVGDSPDAISRIWMRVDDCDRESVFLLKYAAFSVSNNPIAARVEKVSPRKLGCVYTGKLSIVEWLMLIFREESGFSRAVAIRYLGGILEMPTFWANERYQRHSDVVRKLVKGAIQLMEDLMIDTPNGVEMDQTAESDTEGVDLLAESILVGIQEWIRTKVVDDAKSECWSDNLRKLISLLRGWNPIMKDAFPISWHRAATSDWSPFLTAPVSVAREYKDIDVLVTTELEPPFLPHMRTIPDRSFIGRLKRLWKGNEIYDVGITQQRPTLAEDVYNGSSLSNIPSRRPSDPVSHSPFAFEGPRHFGCCF
jgi:hypothetical protein